MEKLFVNFLKEHGAYEQYIANAMTDHEETIAGIMDRNIAEHWIDCAFYWENSQEGFDYWNVLDEEWQEVIKTGYED